MKKVTLVIAVVTCLASTSFGYGVYQVGGESNCSFPEPTMDYS